MQQHGLSHNIFEKCTQLNCNFLPTMTAINQRERRSWTKIKTLHITYTHTHNNARPVVAHLVIVVVIFNVHGNVDYKSKRRYARSSKFHIYDSARERRAIKCTDLLCVNKLNILYLYTYLLYRISSRLHNGQRAHVSLVRASRAA